MILNNAKSIMLGNEQVSKVYCGDRLVWERRSLPSGYELLKYIEFNGKQWIDTEFKPVAGNEIYLKCIFPDSTMMTIISAGTGTYQLLIMGPYVRYFTSTSYNRSGTYNAMYDFYMKGTGEVFRTRLEPYPPVESTNSELVSAVKGEVNTNLFVGKRANDSGYYVGKIYKLDVFGKFESMPVLQKSSNKAGLYNTLTNTFYPNNGSGEFGYETLDGTYVAPV